MSDGAADLHDAAVAARGEVDGHFGAAMRVHDGSRARLLLALRDALDRAAWVVPAMTDASEDQPDEDPDAIDHAHAELAAALATTRAWLHPALLARLKVLVEQLLLYATHRRRVLRSARPAGEAARKHPAGRREPASAPPVMNAPEPLADAVRFGAAAPSAAKAGTAFIARFVAYAADDLDAARQSLCGGAGSTTSAIDIGSAEVVRGTPVAVSFDAPGLVVDADERLQGLVWTGRPVTLQFAVAVPASIALESTMLKFNVLIDGLVLARVRLELALIPVAAVPALEPPEQQHMGAALARSAFASYSSKDRNRVLDRVASIRIATGLDVFLDCRDLQPGRPWQPRLEQEIERRDTFMLFWSKAAAQSRWVTWEWQRALDIKSPERMQIHPLENGVPPPRRLAHLHMADAYLDQRHAERANDG